MLFFFPGTWCFYSVTFKVRNSIVFLQKERKQPEHLKYFELDFFYLVF